MSSQDSTVLLVSLEKESFLDEIIGTLLTTLRAKATVIEAKSAIEAHEALQSNPTAVLVTDAAITDAKHRPTAQALAQYAQTGGTVVLGGLMSSFATPPDFDAMMKDVWKLPWKFGSYTRDEAHLAGAALAWKLEGATKVTLSLAIHLKAVWLADVAQGDRVYTPKYQAQGEAAVAFARCGEGFVGWVGDVNSQNELDAVYVTMLLHPKAPKEEEDDDDDYDD